MIIYHLESHQFLGIFCWLFLDWRQMRVSTVNRKQGEWKSIVITAGQVKLHFNKYLTGLLTQPNVAIMFYNMKTTSVTANFVCLCSAE